MRSQILECAKQRFFKRGINPVTLDDIAKHLRISKKTLYVYFKNKDELVNSLLVSHLEIQRVVAERIHKQAKDVIEELLHIMLHSSEIFNEINPGLFDDLRAYYPKAWKYLEEFKQEYILERLIQLFEKGQKQGLIRKNVNLKLVAYMRLQQIDLLMRADFLREINTTVFDTHKEITEFFICGIATDKGIALMNKYINEKSKK